jgi:conjugative relaxase-like TrwC/TraI family protein
VVGVIATVKPLGLRTRNAATIVAAARRVVEYVQGVAAEAPDRGPAGYYLDSPAVRGRARGSAAALVGLQGVVSGRQLHRLLTGRHAVTEQPLLPVAGSAGRARCARPAVEAADVLTLAQAAEVAGVSARYLRRLARRPAGSEPARQDRLAAVKDPRSGRWVVRGEEVERFIAEREPPTVVLGYDLTCSAPKSVSLLWAFGDQHLRADIAAAMNAGVDAAIRYLERYATVGTVGGRNQTGLGLAVASCRHEVSRAAEAHLHVHNVIVNAVPVPLVDQDGRPLLDEHGQKRVVWRALDGEVLMAHVKTAGYLGAAALRHELSRRRGLVWRPIRNGVAELAGFPAELLEAFSTRTEEVNAEFAALVAAGREPDGATHAAAQRASRAAKKVIADDEVRVIQAERLAETGWTQRQVQDLGARRPRAPAVPTPSDVAALYDSLAGSGGLTERQLTFGLREVHKAVAEWAGDRLDLEAIGAIGKRFLTDPRVVQLEVAGRRRRNRPQPVYTTVDLLQAEADLLDLCRRPSPLSVPARLVDQAIAAVGAPLRGDGRQRRAGLTGEQAGVVRAVLAGGRMVRPVVGPAGSGKTEAMRAVVHAASAAGHLVVGTANGGRQTEELADRLGIPARVVSGWLTLLDNTGDLKTIWPAGTVLVLDEATQVSTCDARRLFGYAAGTGTTVVAVGDPAQLGSVGAGGWFAHLVTGRSDVPALRDNQRQRGPALAKVRAALAALSGPKPRQALDRLAAEGRLRLCADRGEVLAVVVADWQADRCRAGAGPLVDAPRMLAERQADAELLNRAARARLAADGRLQGPAVRVVGREFQAGDEVITLTQAGHTLVPHGQPRSAYIRTGTIGEVVTVDPSCGTLTVHFPGRGQVEVDRAYLTYRFPDGRDGGLAHAYALTAHKAQGATLPTARAVAAEDTSRAGLYVMLSRAHHDLRAYLIARADLDHAPDDETWLPILTGAGDPVDRLAARLDAAQPERLATERNPHAAAAHQLRLRHNLAELTDLRHQAEAGRRPDLDPAVLAWAERAAETAVRTAAVCDPVPALVEAIGQRPSQGPDRDSWDATVSALALYRARYRPTGVAHEPGPEPDPQARTQHEQWQHVVALLDAARTQPMQPPDLTAQPRRPDPELAVGEW